MADSTFEELTEDRCWELLGQGQVGRLAVAVANRPDIFPVNYVVDDGTIVIRSAPGFKFAAATLGTAVAFEVDGLDERRATGWSIVVKGPAEAIEDIAGYLQAEDLDIETWAPGAKPRYMRIVPEQVTGRVIARESVPPCLLNL